VPDVIGLCASIGALKLDPPLDKRTRVKHIIDTVRAFLLMVRPKELIELTLPIRKRVHFCFLKKQQTMNRRGNSHL